MIRKRDGVYYNPTHHEIFEIVEVSTINNGKKVYRIQDGYSVLDCIIYDFIFNNLICLELYND